MKIEKGIAFLLVPILLIAVLSGVNLTADYISTSAKASSEQVILIDAGHPELVRHYRFSDLPPNMQIFKNRTTVRFFGIL